MKFKSKTEAYSYALMVLHNLKKRKHINGPLYPSKELTVCIHQVKKALENHEQDPAVVAEYLKTLKKNITLSKDDKKLITQLRKDLITNNYHQTSEEQFKNPLARRIESNLSLAFLLHPTKAMMRSVNAVSAQLIKLIDDLGPSLDKHLDFFSESKHVIALGTFKSTPTAKEMKKILAKNDPQDLIQIMSLHHKFAQHITRSVPIKHAPHRKPVGALQNVIKTIWPGEPEDFFSQGIAQDTPQATDLRAYIANILFCSSPLHKAFPNKGRTGELIKTRTSQLGLMLPDQKEYEIDLPTHPSKWVADCKGQPADLMSPYVLDLIKNDAVYVSGPSGMTSMMLGQMEFMANFAHEDSKKHYLSVVAAFIVGGGYHSLHEVVGAAEDALKLVPGYKVQAPQTNQRAPAPNYNQYFTQQAAIDPEFNARRTTGWNKYISYFKNHYAPKYLDGYQQPKHLLPAPKDLKNKIMAELEQYIQDGPFARGTKKNQLSFVSVLFRDGKLTQKKLKLAMQFKEAIKSAYNIGDLKMIIEEAKIKNSALEKNAGKVYRGLSQSGFQRIVDNIESLVKDTPKARKQHLK